MQNAAPFLKNTYTWVSAEAGRTAAQAMTTRTATAATPNRTSPPVFPAHAHAYPLCRRPPQVSHRARLGRGSIGAERSQYLGEPIVFGAKSGDNRGETLFGFGCQAEPASAGVVAVGRSAQESRFLGPLDELRHAALADLEA